MSGRSKTKLVVIAIIAIVGLGLPATAWFALTSGPDSLSSGIAAYRKAGLPWTAADLQPLVPANEDGAPLLVSAFEGLDRARARAEEPSIGDALDHGDPGYAENHLAAYAKQLDLVAHAVEKPHAAFTKDWDLGGFVMFPEYAPSKTAVMLLCDRARLKAVKGDIAGSCEDLRLALRLADRIVEQPAMIAALVALSERAVIFQAIEACAVSYSGHVESELALKELLSQVITEVDLVPASRGEAYMNLATLRNYSMLQSRIREMNSSGSSGMTPIDEKKLVRTGDPRGFLVDLFGGPVLINQVRLAETDLADRHDPKRLAADHEVLDRVMMSHHGLKNYLADILSPVFGQLGDQVLRDRAQLTALGALIEAEIVKAQTGRYPATISEFPTRWIDPCDGKPLRFLIGKRSIRLYSVGPDLADNGGKTEYEARGSMHFDVVAGDPSPVRKAASGIKRNR